MRTLLLALVVCVVGCAKAPAPPAVEFDAEKAKELIPEAAGMPMEVVEELSNSTVINPSKLRESRGDCLTLWALVQLGPEGPKDSTSFQFLGEAVRPARIIGAFMGPKDRNGEYRKTATVIHPEYITDCTCAVDGNTATGTVSFKVENVYEGKVDYTARKKDGKWRIEEFRLPDYQTTLTLDSDGKWIWNRATR